SLVSSLAADRAPRLRRRGAPLRPTLMRLTSNLHHPDARTLSARLSLISRLHSRWNFSVIAVSAAIVLGSCTTAQGPMPDPRRYGELVPGASTKDDAIRGPFTAVPALSTLTSTSARNLKVE